MRPTARIPCALTIAGSDSGGGAGIQADLKTFAALGVHGTSVITCLTAQNPRAVLAVQATRTELVRRQLEAVAVLRPRAAKSGMLFSAAIANAVADHFEERKGPPLVVDPVMIATSGARLLRPDAVAVLCRRLLPLAALATPNLDETRLLTGVEVREPADLSRAARALRDRYGCAALIKGGHLAGGDAFDVFWDGREELCLRSRRVTGVSTHGTGCTLSAAVVGFLALGCSLADAVRKAKAYIVPALTRAWRVEGFTVLNHGAGAGRGSPRGRPGSR